jgi:phosphatidylglycerol---prolipoprotein diacylglyceryl transferase
MFDWLHNANPNSVFIDLGFIAINWYGLLILTGILSGLVVSRYLFNKYKLPLDQLYNLFFFLVIFGLIGARLYHVLNEIGYYWQRPLEIFAVWQGGLAWHGAILAGLVVTGIYLKQHKDFCQLLCYEKEFSANHKFQTTNSKPQIPSLKNKSFVLSGFLFLADLLAPALALGQAVGRWGNYFNQELYGLPTGLPWGIPIASAKRVVGFEQFNYFQPTFLYESLAAILIFALLIWLHSRRQRSFQISHLKFYILKRPGSIFAAYIGFSAISRILTELLRIDQTPVIVGVRLPILVSGLLFVLGLWFLWYTYFRSYAEFK